MVGLAVIAATTAGCGRETRDQSAPEASMNGSPQPVAAGASVTAMLDGLRVGDTLAKHRVTWIGDVDREGTVRVRFESGGRVVRAVIALRSERPRPPVTTSRYALFYEGLDHRNAATEEEAKLVIEALGQRVRRVEERVEAPAGMRVLSPPTMSM